MTCEQCKDALNAYLDGELPRAEHDEVDRHLDGCPLCREDERALSNLGKSVKESLVRYRAPDVLQARVRAAVGRGGPLALSPTPAVRSPWRLAAAGVFIAAMSSALTFAALRPGIRDDGIANQIVASHIRSLMPGHLTDVVSTDQHNVKPWFNGRVDMSPNVPDLSAAGFPLVGGRLDYLDGRRVPVTVYSRRQHLINVYATPSPAAQTTPAKSSSFNGYHIVEWKQDGIEQWAVSDLNFGELTQFVRGFRGK